MVNSLVFGREVESQGDGQGRPSEVKDPSGLKQGLATMVCFSEQGFSEHSHARLLLYRLWLLSSYNSREELLPWRIYGPQS